MIYLERIIALLLVAFLIYKMFTSKCLDNWINRKFNSRNRNAEELLEETERIRLEKESTATLIKEKQKSVKQQQKILEKLNKN